MSAPELRPASFPADGSRLVVYAMDDRRGGVEDFVLYALKALRPFADRILVVAVGDLTATARQAIETTADEVIVARGGNPGIWAHREALAHVGSAVTEYDEVLLTGDGWFGPVHSLGPVFETMERRSLDLWGITDRRDRWDDDTPRDGVVSLSPYWLAARSRLVRSQEWAHYWRTLPPRRPAGWSAERMELDLTAHFLARGFRSGSAFPEVDYPSDHPDMFNIELLIADGCPAVVRNAFDNYPLFLDQHAVIGRRIARVMGEAGFPLELLWRTLSRTVAPKTLNTSAAMLEVLPDYPRIPSRTDRRILVVTHIARNEGVTELFRRIRSIPGRLSVVATVAESDWTDDIRVCWQQSGDEDESVTFEVRTAAGRHGPDSVTVFAECRDLLESGQYELVVAVHTGVPDGVVRNTQHYFRKQQIENLLHTPGYIANLLGLFDLEPGLGLVFPPTPHIGMSTLGAGWGDFRPVAEKLTKQLGVEVPLDWASPHGPVGGMWIGRPDAVAPLATLEWPPDDLGRTAAHSRLHAYVAGERGYHTRTVATAEHAGLSHSSLEYTLDHMSMTMYGYPAGYTALLHRAGPFGSGRAADFARMYLGLHRPRVLRVFAPVRGLSRRLRNAVRTLKRLSGPPAGAQG
ncbi:rhamnan synthesis F family protein [uncultured Microbacterium sp.]|uniref:rhamnan synthesis F family protein n=1 Tax=uncultured Microbacterium sp. TaxID=191216 RepID=UPI0035C970FE